MKTRVIAVEYPLPGETHFEEITEETATVIARDFYDFVCLVKMDRAGYGVKCHSGYVACIGTVNHPIHGPCPAILHKTEPRRELQLLAIPELPATRIVSDLWHCHDGWACSVGFVVDGKSNDDLNDQLRKIWVGKSTQSFYRSSQTRAIAEIKMAKKIAIAQTILPGAPVINRN